MSLIISLLLAAGIGVFTWFNAKRAFALLPLMLPAYLIRTSIGSFPTTALELSVLVLFAVWYVRSGWKLTRDALSRRGPPRTNEGYLLWIWPVLLWLFAGFVSVIVSPVHVQALGLFRAYFTEPLLMFFMGLAIIRTDEDRRLLMKSVAAVTIILGIWALVQMLTGWGIPYPWTDLPGRRAVGPFPFPNALSLFVAPIVALAFADMVSARGTRHANAMSGPRNPERVSEGHHSPLTSPILGWATVAFGLLAILCAKSNGGLVAVIVAMFVTLILTKKMWKWALAFALVVALAVFATPLRNKAISVLSFHEWSGQVRTVMWGETVTMLRDRPFYGAGLAAYPTVILPYHKAKWMEVFQYPHDIVLNLWSETGMLGLVAFAWILVTWTRLASKKGKWKAENGKRDKIEGPSVPLTTYHLPLTPAAIPAIAVITAMLIQGLVDVPYFKNDLSILFWLLILLTTASYETKPNAH